MHTTKRSQLAENAAAITRTYNNWVTLWPNYYLSGEDVGEIIAPFQPRPLNTPSIRAYENHP
jgi:hypothetical protein